MRLPLGEPDAAIVVQQGLPPVLRVTLTVVESLGAARGKTTACARARCRTPRPPSGTRQIQPRRQAVNLRE